MESSGISYRVSSFTPASCVSHASNDAWDTFIFPCLCPTGRTFHNIECTMYYVSKKLECKCASSLVIILISLYSGPLLERLPKMHHSVVLDNRWSFKGNRKMLLVDCIMNESTPSMVFSRIYSWLLHMNHSVNRQSV